jgi:hypothetical protein
VENIASLSNRVFVEISRVYEWHLEAVASWDKTCKPDCYLCARQEMITAWKAAWEATVGVPSG